MFRFTELVLLVAGWSSVASAHTVIVYPGWRGNNIISNGTVALDDPSIIPGSLGINENNGTKSFPYGMQWMYPCGGMPTSTNRTKWPVTGGAISVQPGWFPGHSLALFYINMGIGTEPLNMSHAMLPMFQIAGPSNVQYDGTFCLPQVPLPANYTPQIGDNATIQIVEAAQHGAALYNCADITFADPKDVPEVNSSNCFNSSEIRFNLVYSTAEESAADSTVLFNYMSLLFPLVMMVASLYI